MEQDEKTREREIKETSRQMEKNITNGKNVNYSLKSETVNTTN